MIFNILLHFGLFICVTLFLCKFFFQKFINKVLILKGKLHFDKVSFVFYGVKINYIELKFSKYTLKLYNSVIRFTLFKKQKVLLISDQLIISKVDGDDFHAYKNHQRESSINLNHKLNQLLSFFYNRKFNLIKCSINSINILGLFFFDKTVITSKEVFFELVKARKVKVNIVARIRINSKNIEYKFFSKFNNTNENISFKEIFGDLKSQISDRNTVTTEFEIHNLFIDHKGISETPILVERMDINFKLKLEHDKIHISDESSICIGKIKINIRKIIDFNDLDFFNIQFLIDFKPEELLRILPCLYQKDLFLLRSEGSIEVLINFGFLWSDPLTHKFTLEYDDSNLTVLNSGINLSFLFETFNYKKNDDLLNHKNPIKIDPFDNSLLENSILNRIVVLAEDPSFYQHKGFDFYNIGCALACNLSNKKFSRGGSTITMQIVKNILLDSSKTLLRKLEEAVITSLIENYFKIEKPNLLIIYFSILKMSKNVYGIRDGAKYYFNKELLQLNIIESIVLSYIIPRPDFFEEAVRIKSNQLNKNLCYHIDNILDEYNFIYQNEIDKLQEISPSILFANDLGEIILKYSKYLTKC